MKITTPLRDMTPHGWQAAATTAIRTEEPACVDVTLDDIGSSQAGLHSSPLFSLSSWVDWLLEGGLRDQLGAVAAANGRTCTRRSRRIPGDLTSGRSRRGKKRLYPRNDAIDDCTPLTTIERSTSIEDETSSDDDEAESVDSSLLLDHYQHGVALCSDVPPHLLVNEGDSLSLDDRVICVQESRLPTYRQAVTHGRQLPWHCGKLHQNVSPGEMVLPQGGYDDEIQSAVSVPFEDCYGHQQQISDNSLSCRNLKSLMECKKNAGLYTRKSYLSARPFRCKMTQFTQHSHGFKTQRVLTSYRSKWNHDTPILQPACNPKWLFKLQQRLPWFADTVQAGGGPWLSARAWEAPYRWFVRELRARLGNKGDRWLLCMRFGLTAILIVALFTINIIAQKTLYEVADVPEIYDWVHMITKGLNDHLHNNATLFSVIVLFSSLLMDLVFLIVWLQWIVIGDSFRLPIAYIFLYSLRALMRSMCILPFPPGYIWHAPQFKGIQVLSLTVPYQPSDDFFYSGHVGCSVLASVEHFYYRCWWGFAFSVTVACVQFFVLTITRGHYTIDMIVGAIVAHWVHLVARKVTRPVDQWLGLPPRPILVPVTVDHQQRRPIGDKPVVTMEVAQLQSDVVRKAGHATLNARATQTADTSAEHPARSAHNVLLNTSDGVSYF